MYGWHKHESLAFLKALLKLCRNVEANIITGPAVSGTVIASAVGALSLVDGKQSLSAVLLGKQYGLYQKSKHSESPQIIYRDSYLQAPWRAVLVDDCTVSGQTMICAGDEFSEKWPEARIVAIAIGANDFWQPAQQMLRKKFPDTALYSWSTQYGMIKRSR